MQAVMGGVTGHLEAATGPPPIARRLEAGRGFAHAPPDVVAPSKARY
jgi:hypothetical protein